VVVRIVTRPSRRSQYGVRVSSPLPPSAQPSGRNPLDVPSLLSAPEFTTAPDSASAATPEDLRRLREEFTRFLMRYKFGMDEVETKVSILRQEFTHLQDYNPIEHVTSRLKSPESILAKIERKGIDPSFEAIREGINDIAGVRIVCSFVTDVYRIWDALTRQTDLGVIDVRDYIAAPKPNGYKSLHAIVEVPVFLSDGPVPVRVEVQIRTIAMDFWASLEHKIFYKYNRRVPDELLDDLCQAAETASALDATMERLHDEVRSLDADVEARPRDDGGIVPDEGVVRRLRDVQRRRRSSRRQPSPGE
jgi:putative GTP pyrophosphokinase